MSAERGTRNGNGATGRLGLRGQAPAVPRSAVDRRLVLSAKDLVVEYRFNPRLREGA